MTQTHLINQLSSLMTEILLDNCRCSSCDKILNDIKTPYLPVDLQACNWATVVLGGLMLMNPRPSCPPQTPPHNRYDWLRCARLHLGTQVIVWTNTFTGIAATFGASHKIQLPSRALILVTSMLHERYNDYKGRGCTFGPFPATNRYKS